MPLTASSLACDLPAVQAAAQRLAGVAVRTPLLESPLLNESLGCRLLVKAECLQVTGSFKFRGAYNRLSQLDAEARRRGVVAFSSGNHAQGVAYAAALLGMRAVIVMPADAPAMKIANTKAYGAEVILYDRRNEDREEIGRRLAAADGATVVPPYDDPDIIAGQGTVGLEIAQQCADLGLSPDAVLVNASGGGLTAGLATAVRALAPACAIYTAEPELHDDHRRSLAEGTPVENADPPPSICDALMAKSPGRLTFPINAALCAGGVAVNDDAVRRAMVTAATRLKIVLEPGGAVALAATLTGQIAVRDRVIVVVGSGGNVDPGMLAATMRDYPPF